MLSRSPPPHLEHGGEGDILLFSHANGYPPLSYRRLLDSLTDSNRVIASLHRPLWAENHSEMPSWWTLGTDLERLVQAQSGPVVAVGHSMGASVLAMAAARQPELFRGIVLIEPVLIRPIYSWLLNALRPIAKRRVPFIRATLARTDNWADKEEAFAHFRAKPVFRRIPDSQLRDYVEHGTGGTGDERSLVFSKDWEAHCYLRIANLWPVITNLQVPVLGVRGALSNTLPRQQWQRWQQRTRHDFLELPDCGHLLPFEQPDLLTDHIQQWLAALPQASK